MRIALLTPEYAGSTSRGGGLETRYAVLGPELARQGHEVHVLVPTQQTAERRSGVQIHPLSARPLPRRPPFGERAMAEHARRIVRELDPDVVYGPEWRGLGQRSTGLPGTPFVTNLTSSLAQIRTLMANWRPGPLRRLAHVAQLAAERRQTEHSTGVVATSAAVLRWSRELWDLGDVPGVVIANTVDVERARRLGGASASTVGSPPDGPVVAYSGRLEERKGVAHLVAAMTRVWSRRPDAQLVLAGRDSAFARGTMSEHLRAEAGPWGDRLRICGDLAAPELFALLAGADIVVTPSLWEAFGNSALEAMALGRAVVATSGSGFEDFMTHDENALLVAPADPVALAEALEALLDDDSLRRRLGEAASATADRYAPEPVVARLAAHLELVASG